MIRFALRCRSGHGFDGWFRSGDDFERQAASDLVSCPECGSTAVGKALMRPSIARAPEPSAPAPAEPKGAVGGVPPEKAAEIMTQLQAISRELRAGADYVGGGFAEEARRIHFGEAQARRIYGEATGAEIRALGEDGIAAVPLPPLPEDRH